MKKNIYTFITAVIVASILMVSCADKTDNNLNQTGLIDQRGNLITNTLIKTNIAHFSGTIPIWATNGKYDYIITTNISSDSGRDSSDIEIKYTNNVIIPNEPEDPSEYYKIFVPYSRTTYHTVSYKDTNRLKQIWLEQIFRKSHSDGKVFAIRNRDNNRDIDNFQNLHNHNGEQRYDYYYFNDDGDIVYKGGDKTRWQEEIIVKRFVGAVIVDYRKLIKRTYESLPYKQFDQIEHTGEWTVGGIYQMSVTVNEARERFKGAQFLDGVYDFIAARKAIWLKDHNGIQYKTTFLRQFYSINFMEVLVLNPYGNEGNANCLGVDAYYAYFGDGTDAEGVSMPKGFTPENIPYMQDPKIYLARRPESVVALLTHTTTFTDAGRNFKYLAMPGHKY